MNELEGHSDRHESCLTNRKQKHLTQPAVTDNSWKQPEELPPGTETWPEGILVRLQQFSHDEVAWPCPANQRALQKAQMFGYTSATTTETTTTAFIRADRTDGVTNNDMKMRIPKTFSTMFLGCSTSYTNTVGVAVGLLLQNDSVG